MAPAREAAPSSGELEEDADRHPPTGTERSTAASVSMGTLLRIGFTIRTIIRQVSERYQLFAYLDGDLDFRIR